MLICTVSDQFGIEVITSQLEDIDVEDILDEDNLSSLYKVKDSKWENRDNTGYNSSHPTFWLNKYGTEICLGDYV
jgi:ppGpp synthetase/RelA/SpoT-type nucleotidyltranferase